MTVMEIGIPSGFYPDQQSLTRLVDQGKHDKHLMLFCYFFSAFQELNDTNKTRTKLFCTLVV